MRVFDVEILKYLDWKGAILLIGGYGLQDLPEGIDEVWYDELVFFSDSVSIFFVLLTEDPSVDSLGDGDLLLLEESQQSLHQYLPVIFGEEFRLDAEVGKHEI